MSYDLFFQARKTGATVTYDEFADYFSSRRHYDVKEGQAWYTNEDTGVYFVFEFDTSDDAAEQGAEPLLPVTFNLNYFRPHPFGMEAEPEVRSFVTTFGLLVCDGQVMGMGEGEYSTDGFLRGWNSGNEFGYRAMVSQAPDALPMTLTSAIIQSCWLWNYQREARQTAIGESAFVPRIVFIDRDGKVASAVIWTDGIPSLLPEVDLLLVPRKRFAPRRLFRSSTEDMVTLEWPQIAPVLKRFQRSMSELACFELFYAETPDDIAQLIRKARPPAVAPQGLSFDQVLNQELVEAATKSKR